MVEIESCFFNFRFFNFESQLLIAPDLNPPTRERERERFIFYFCLRIMTTSYLEKGGAYDYKLGSSPGIVQLLPYQYFIYLFFN